MKSQSNLHKDSFKSSRLNDLKIWLKLEGMTHFISIGIGLFVVVSIIVLGCPKVLRIFHHDNAKVNKSKLTYK